MENPLISIIIATYNSSHVLRYAIQSVLDSDYQNWEMIVIGDCCTDDTEAVVLGFEDPRISFSNLDQNSGQQAKPTNVALGKVKGEYITFLNQDDMFFHDHLGNCVELMQESKFDFIITPGLKIWESSQENLEKGNFEVEMNPVHPEDTFAPQLMTVASTWFIRRDVPCKLGPWKKESEVYVTPSQEWLFRAILKNLKFCYSKKVGVLIIHAGARKGFYNQTSSYEHEYFFTRLADTTFKSILFEKAALASTNRFNHRIFLGPNSLIKNVIVAKWNRILIKFKIHPNTITYFFKWGKKGKFIAHIKNITQA